MQAIRWPFSGLRLKTQVSRCLGSLVRNPGHVRSAGLTHTAGVLGAWNIVLMLPIVLIATAWDEDSWTGFTATVFGWIVRGYSGIVSAWSNTRTGSEGLGRQRAVGLPVGEGGSSHISNYCYGWTGPHRSLVHAGRLGDQSSTWVLMYFQARCGVTTPRAGNVTYRNSCLGALTHLVHLFNDHTLFGCRKPRRCGWYLGPSSSWAAS